MTDQGHAMTAPLDTPLPCRSAPMAARRWSRCAKPDRATTLYYRVQCRNCGCCLDDDETAAEALAKWNRRAPVRDVTCQTDGTT